MRRYTGVAQRVVVVESAGSTSGRSRPVLILDVDQTPGPPRCLRVAMRNAPLAIGRERIAPEPLRIGAQQLHGVRPDRCRIRQLWRQRVRVPVLGAKSLAQ